MGITLRLLRAFILHTPLVPGTTNPIEVGRNDSEAYELAFLCRREELKFGHCLVNWLKCYYRKDCGREHMLMKLICSGKENARPTPRENATRVHGAPPPKVGLARSPRPLFRRRRTRRPVRGRSRRA
ncbi:hypothetical protein SKAU_G00346120 [Synaphobranchus kaupii]|uniref:Uncharacterized protein n=1 Tax=Synaphobranchus kaupii TaxID=118154 RepID=A0A9Q1EJG0_SYNKA|nr:hypothetical protein SKAU_G00346120 [Synaphobranchus kaupii]